MSQIFPGDDHDTVARKYADLVAKNNPDTYRVVANPVAESKELLAGMDPDIILYGLKDSAVKLVIEVETAATISSEQAAGRWKPLSAAAPKFQILLPKGTLNRAKRYCKQFGVKAGFQEY